ncbi:MAG: DUF1211 domain-containing protein [Burkholderiaceae bacterium]|nr:MAG: DUF1211 domain-containing protein [Burkholderiaceae bacterium]
MSDSELEPHFSKHRLEALCDGIFAIAMTLLVIELKLPEELHGANANEVGAQLLRLMPLLMSWLLSFLVLAIFWIAHYRLFSYLKHVTMPLIWLTVWTLGAASLLPFSSSLNSQHSSFLSQSIYSANMILLSLGTIFSMRYLYKHPQICSHTIGKGVYHAAQFRALGLIFLAALALGVSPYLPPGAGNMCFALMPLIVSFAARIQKRYQ